MKTPLVNPHNVHRQAQSYRWSSSHLVNQRARLRVLIYTMEHDLSIQPQPWQLLSLKKILGDIDRRIAPPAVPQRLQESGVRMTRNRRSSDQYPGNAPEREERQAIVLYSPDMDYCMSLRLLFQDRYNMITTTDVNMVVTIVNAFQPDLVIIDALPTLRMRRRVEMMKRSNADLRVMFFCTQRFSDQETHDFIRSSVDAVFSKPVDLVERATA